MFAGQLVAAEQRTLNWSDLHGIRVVTPAAKLSESARSRFFETQSRRTLGKPGTNLFHGFARVTQLTESKGKWIATAVQELTDDEQFKRDLRAVNGTPTFGTFSAAAAAAGGNANGPDIDRSPSITWELDAKPKFKHNSTVTIDGAITGATWDDKTITVKIDTTPIKP